MLSAELDPLAVLSDPEAHVVAPVTGVDELDALATLMARFTNGPAHEGRRRVAVEALAKVDTTVLRHSAQAWISAALAEERDPDLTALARRVVVATLASAMGFAGRDEVAGAMVVVAARLAPRGDRDAPAAGAVRSAIATLEASARTVDPVVRANLIAALFQAVDATTGLVTNALQRAATVDVGVGLDANDLERLIDGTLASDPPVQRTRRLLAGTGEVVVVPLTGGNLEFGAGMHECPGRSLARALAMGMVEAVLAEGCVDGISVTYEDRWNLRIVDQQRLARADVNAPAFCRNQNPGT